MMVELNKNTAQEFQKAAQEIQKTLGDAAPTAADLVKFHLASANSDEMVEQFRSTLHHVLHHQDENTLPLPLEEV